MQIFYLAQKLKVIHFIQTEHQREFPTHVMKWNSLLNDLIDNDNWNIYYKVCFWTIKDNSLTWFQYRVLFRILGTRSYLYKIKIADSNLCGLCGSENETIVHIFTECSNVKELWINIVSWIENKLSAKFELDTATKLLGYHVQNEHFWQLNFILMITRQYIFSCVRNKARINIFRLQQIAKEKFEEQESLANINGQEQLFIRKWMFWKELFSGL